MTSKLNKLYKNVLRTSVLALVITFPNVLYAGIITHNAASFTGAITPPFGPLADPVGTAFIGSGVDYTFGNTEGVFNDPPFAFCGINGSNVCDLVTDVDGRIVLTNSLTQGFTDFVEVKAGSAAPNTLTLSVFDINQVLISTSSNTNGGVDTFSVDLAGVFSIAFFSVSGNDSYGVQEVSIEEAVTDVPVTAPATLGILGLGLTGLGLARRRRFKF